MQFKIKVDGGYEIKVSHTVPAHCRRLVIPSAKVLYTEGAFGNIFSQEIAVRYFMIEYHHLEIHRGVDLFQSANDKAYMLNYHLKGNIYCTVDSEGFLLVESNYYLFNMIDSEHKMQYEPGVYDSFHITFDPKYLELFARKYQRLKKLAELLQHEPTTTMKFSEKISGSSLNDITQILRSSDDELENVILYHGLSNQLIIQFLRDSQKVAASELPPKNMISRTLKEITSYITNHLEEELTVEKLAKRFSISEGSLKRHFSQALQKGVHDFIKECRMVKAIDLLSKDVPIQMIAELTGYGTVQSFSKAFSAHSGVSPSDYKRKVSQMDN